MNTLRVEKAAIKELKEKDPNCPICGYTLRKLAADGKIKIAKIGNKRFYIMESIYNFMAGQGGAAE